MSDLLLELFSEEIPAHMQSQACDSLRDQITKYLDSEQLSYKDIDVFATPRRLILIVRDLPNQQPDFHIEKKGPRADASDSAIQGFLKSTGFSLEDCEKRETPKGPVLFAVQVKAGQKTSKVISDFMPKLLRGLSWQKSMRWGSGEFRWVRPLRRILCILGKDEVSFSFEGLVSGRVTSGHRFMSPEEFTVDDLEDYLKKISKANVLISSNERKSKILERAKKLAASSGLVLDEDQFVLNENIGLTEWPQPLLGNFDKSFLALPEEVLISAMRRHQRYFALRNTQGELASSFVMVANIETTDSCSAVILGNERVIRARLADARFFWDLDLKRDLESSLPLLNDVVFKESLGSLGDKVRRLVESSEKLCNYIPGSDVESAKRSALLCKADLTSSMVAEFPDLQGIMGSHYAQFGGEDLGVVNAICEHYKPQGPSDICPKSPTSIAVALADKLDTLAGLFSINEKPTGSKDPFALRRAALGVIRLIVENNLRMPLRKVLQDIVESYGTLTDCGLSKNEVLSSLTDFFAERLKVHLRGSGIRHDLVSAVFSVDGGDDLVRLISRVNALDSFIQSDNGANLLVAYRRAANILRKEESRGENFFSQDVDYNLLEENAEKELAKKINTINRDAKNFISNEDYIRSMQVMSQLRDPVDQFFDEVTVNVEDHDLRVNRLRILSNIKVTMDSAADFSLIEG